MNRFGGDQGLCLIHWIRLVRPITNRLVARSVSPTVFQHLHSFRNFYAHRDMGRAGHWNGRCGA